LSTIRALLLFASLQLMSTSASPQELALHIESAAPAVAVGEEIRLVVSLQSPAAVKVAKFFMSPGNERSKSSLEIQVHDEAGRRIARASHVMTGRALHHPQVTTAGPGETYRESIQLAGTFSMKQGSSRKKLARPLWSFGEDPATTSASEYPAMTAGTFKVTAVYRVDDPYLVSLDEAQRAELWRGELVSNTIELVVR
jgi:hypothetical protein